MDSSTLPCRSCSQDPSKLLSCSNPTCLLNKRCREYPTPLASRDTGQGQEVGHRLHHPKRSSTKKWDRGSACNFSSKAQAGKPAVRCLCRDLVTGGHPQNQTVTGQDMTVSRPRHRGTLQAGLALEQQQVCLEVPHPKGLLCLQTSLKACGVAHCAPHPPS